MSNSYQKEVAPARVNITLNVENYGESQQKELPMKLLMLDNFSGKNPALANSKTKSVSISKQNFDSVMASLCPSVTFTLDNHLSAHPTKLPINLSFKRIQDFQPYEVVRNVPQLQRLLAMRNLLKDLKACVIDNQQFSAALKQLMKNPTQAERLKRELSQCSPLKD